MMTPGQKRTAKFLGIWLALGLVMLLGLLGIELVGVGAGDGASISRLMWGLWADEPWVVLIVSHTIAAPTWYLLGHFTSQRRSVYDDIRAGKY